MATPTSVESPLSVAPSREDLIRAYRAMYMARRLDDREILLKRQNRIFFQISGAGHEAAQAAAGLAFKPGHDWFYLYYRDRALALTLGMTAEQMLLGSVGAAADPASGGRQMPSHWGLPDLHIVSSSSPTGTHYLHAVGCAQAGRILAPDSDEVTLICSGEGATSEGEFWEAMNAACLENLPVIFLIEDNGYAISVPVEKQTAGGNVAHLLAGFPNLKRIEVDGTDFLASYSAISDAIAYARARRGPTLVRATVTRPYSHSLSDDEKLYKTKAERDAEEARDPVIKFPEWLVSEGILDRHALQVIVHEVDKEIQEATERVLRADPPPKGSALVHLYSEDVDPCSAEFDREPEFSGDPRTMVDSINLTLHEEMARDPRILVFGEDVADCSREATLAEVKGKGGVFKATAGLQIKFGSARSFNTPIAEASIIGRAIGMATRGLKPIPEIQFFDYIWPAMMQIRDELATLRWRSNNGFSAPVVVRVAIGGYLNGGAIYHSQCGEVIFAHKRLSREPYNRSQHPGPNYTIPFAKANLVKSGQNLSIITYGALVQKSLQAATQIEQRFADRTVEVIDLRTLSPYDWNAIRASVEKTNRVLIAHEDCISFGYGAEIAARIANELFEYLDAPVGRVAALDTWVGYNPQLEYEILPQVENLVTEAERILSY